MKLPVTFVRHSHFWFLLGSLFTVFCAYSVGLNGPLLFDDYANIVDNKSLTGTTESLIDLRTAALSSESSTLHRPVSTFTFSLQAPADGGSWSPAKLKLGNVVIHLMCAVCVFWFSTMLARAPALGEWSNNFKTWWPIVATAIWALNPSHVSTVLYSVQRMAQLSTLLVLLGLCAFVVWRIRLCSGRFEFDEALSAVLWIALCIVFGVLAKENAILLPWLIAITEFAFFRGRVAHGTPVLLRRMSALVFFTPLFLFAAFVYLKLDWIEAGYAVRPFDLAERVMTQMRLLWSYAVWFCVPRLDNFGLFHDDLVVSTGLLAPVTTLISIVAWSVTLLVGFWARKKYPLLLFVTFFFLAAHSIESSVLALEMVFEHRNYLPSVSLSFGLAAILLKLNEVGTRVGTSRTLSALPTVVLLVALTLVTFIRALSWGSELSMARAQIERHPDSERNGYLYANALINSGIETSGPARQEYFALARHEFELLAQKHPNSLPIQVMLYITDVKLYPQFNQADDRFRALERSARDLSAVSATDIAALGALVNCYIEPGCFVDTSRLEALLSTVRAQDRRPKAIEQLQLEVLRENATNAESRDLYSQQLADASRRYPSDISIVYQLISDRLARQEFAAAHEAVIELMRLDPLRRQLPAMRDTFAINKQIR